MIVVEQIKQEREYRVVAATNVLGFSVESLPNFTREKHSREKLVRADSRFCASSEKHPKPNFS